MSEPSQWISPELYPDVFQSGGLGPLLEDTARRAGVDPGPITPVDGVQGFWTVLLRTDHGVVGVFLGSDQRVFLINVSVESRPWASGFTEDPTEVVRVADLWRRGTTLHGLHERFPFMTYTRLAEGYERGNPIEAQWQDLLEREDLRQIRPLLQAAQADEVLGPLFPMVTHYTLARFDLDHWNRGAAQVRIGLTPDGRYQVEASWVDGSRLVDSISEAVTLANEFIHVRRNGAADEGPVP